MDKAPKMEEKETLRQRGNFTFPLYFCARVTVMNLVLTFSVHIFVPLLHMWNHK